MFAFFLGWGDARAVGPVVFALLSAGCGPSAGPDGGGEATGGAAGMGGAGAGSVAEGGSSPTDDGGSSSSGTPFDPQPERCDNGIDDDGNGLTDCADPACTEGYRCLPAAPKGWDGPKVMHLDDDLSVACPSTWPDLALRAGAGELDAPPAECAACDCDEPADAYCSEFTYETYQGPSCDGPWGLKTKVNGTGCIHWTKPGAIKITHTKSNASCGASGGAPTVTSAQFEQEATICSAAPLGGGCDLDAGVCVPKVDSAAWPLHCISRTGDKACPSGAYSERHLLHEAFDDTRDCTGCVCEPTGLGACAVPITEGGCNQSVKSLVTSGTCVDASNFVGGVAVVPNKATVPGVGCAVSQAAQPNGEAKPKLPVTVCCLRLK